MIEPVLADNIILGSLFTISITWKNVCDEDNAELDILFTVKIPDFPLHNNEYEDQLGFHNMNESDIKNEQEH